MTEVTTIVIDKEYHKEIKKLIWNPLSSQEIETELNSLSGIDKFTQFFLTLSSLNERHEETLLKYLQKFNNNFQEVINHQRAVALKLIIDVRIKGSGFYDQNNIELNKELDNLNALLSTYIDAKKLKFKDRLVSRFSAFPFSNNETVASSFKNFPEEELWRFYVDGRYQLIPTQIGWVKFEKREPGCLYAMHKAFKQSLSIENRLNMETLNRLHQCATEKVENIKSGHKKIRGMDTVSYDMLEFSLLGLDELFTTNAHHWRSYYTDGNFDFTDHDAILSHESKKYRSLYVQYKPKSQEEIKAIVESILERYYEKLEKYKDDRFQTFMSIIELSSSMIRLHPYNDGNGRVLVNILMNKELLNNHFPCTILNNPNWFDNLSQMELADEVLSGMETFEYIKKHKAYPGAAPQYITDNIIGYLKSKNEEYLINIIPEGFETEISKEPHINLRSQ